MIVAGWVREVLDQVGSISLPLLFLAVTLHTCETLLNALAWRNILRRAYPNSGVSYRLVLGGYGGGIGLNAMLPAQAGTVAMLGLYRTQIQASTALGLIGAGAVQNAFFPPAASAPNRRSRPPRSATPPPRASSPPTPSASSSSSPHGTSRSACSYSGRPSAGPPPALSSTIRRPHRTWHEASPHPAPAEQRRHATS